MAGACDAVELGTIPGMESVYVAQAHFDHEPGFIVGVYASVGDAIAACEASESFMAREQSIELWTVGGEEFVYVAERRVNHPKGGEHGPWKAAGGCIDRDEDGHQCGACDWCEVPSLPPSARPVSP